MKLCINCVHYELVQWRPPEEDKQRSKSGWLHDEDYHYCHQMRDPVTGKKIISQCGYNRQNVDHVTGVLCGPEGRFYEEKPFK